MPCLDYDVGSTSLATRPGFSCKPERPIKWLDSSRNLLKQASKHSSNTMGDKVFSASLCHSCRTRLPAATRHWLEASTSRLTGPPLVHQCADPKEVEEHNKEDSAWIIIDNGCGTFIPPDSPFPRSLLADAAGGVPPRVYDVTEFLPGAAPNNAVDT